MTDPNPDSMPRLQAAHPVNRAATLLLLVLPHLANSSNMDSRDMASKVSLVRRVAVMEDTNPP